MLDGTHSSLFLVGDTELKVQAKSRILKEPVPSATSNCNAVSPMSEAKISLVYIMSGDGAKTDSDESPAADMIS